MANGEQFDTQYFFSYCQSLYENDEAFDEQQTDRFKRHRHLQPDSAKFLASLIISSGAKKVLEIGTSTGYSTLWIAYALKHQPDAQLITLDIDKARSNIAQHHLQNVELSRQVCFKVEDALTFFQYYNQPFELIFLDAERQYYVEYLPFIHSLLPIRGILIVDNVLSHPNEVKDFLKDFENDSRYLCSTLSLGSGLFMAVRQEL